MSNIDSPSQAINFDESPLHSGRSSFAACAGGEKPLNILKPCCSGQTSHQSLFTLSLSSMEHGLTIADSTIAQGQSTDGNCSSEI
jgi:hypothetical protein